MAMATDASTASPSLTGASRVKSSEIIQLLSTIGVEANTATVMVYLHTQGPSKSSDLQKICKLRQPDVSVAINHLNRLNLIEVIVNSKGGRGRPAHTYKLAIELNDALKTFTEQAETRLAVLKNHISRVAQVTEIIEN
tara:strand:+ start:25218 stop:25631 length:414 start_codon:yes stop_codon:yes gene_type:complete